jgi:SAM-dependent methyltransferase
MTGSPPPQNIYDDPAFFAAYARLERFGAGWTTAFEHASFLGLLPDVAGRRVLDLGCGMGQLAHYLASRGAAEVIGVDLSEQMLARARAGWSHPRVTYRRTAMEEVVFPPDRFELVVSSLAVHYVADYAGLCQRIATWLVPGGTLVFSTEHPVYLSRATSDGWVPNPAGGPHVWVVDRYGDEGLREEEWLIAGVQKYHRMLATLLNGLIDAGLAIERVLEPMPDDAMLQRHPDWIEVRKRPFILLIRARNRDAGRSGS